MADIKKMVPPWIKSYIKMGLDRPIYRKLKKDIPRCEHQRIFILGTPIHRNLGDHLIAEAEKEFLLSLYPNRRIFEIPLDTIPYFIDTISKSNNMSDLIVISGGGWMGNVWPQHERLIQKLVVRFARQRVIIMPQTIYYDRGIEPYRSLISDSKRAFGQSNNLTLCLRDKASYEFASSELNIENAVLVPDIALSYLPFVKRVPTRERDKKVAFCLREDQECAREKSTTELLEAFFQEKDVPCGVIDTLNNTPVSLSERKTVLEKKFGEFSSYSLIVTDRLHAMVFAYLTGTPCIVIDNLTCKVSGVYNSWLKDCEYIHPLFHSNCTEDLFEWIEEMMAGRYEPAESNLCSEGLKRLEDAINNG